MARGINTKCTHLEEDEQSIKNYGAISYPIYQTATYAHMGVGRSTGFDYSRLQNPTREQLEKVVASLENGIDAIAFSTGMAAITMMWILTCMAGVSVSFTMFPPKMALNFPVWTAIKKMWKAL